MNVIPIVFSILMLLAIITYAQLQTFVLRNVSRVEYVCHMANRSRDNINLLQDQLYQDHKVPGEKSENGNRVDAVSQVNLRIFESEPTIQNQIFYDAHNEIVKRLIDILYANRPFYQDFEEKRPDVVNELWREVRQELQREKNQRQGIKKAKHLANLRLGDPELQEFLANMLKRVQTPESLIYDCQSKGSESKKAVYYPNLIDYLAVQSSDMKPYRVWLAPRPLLLAIFQDPNVVDAIAVEREQLYGQLKQVPKERRDQVKNEMKFTFQRLFQNKLPSNIPEGIVNFDVSLSRPRN